MFRTDDLNSSANPPVCAFMYGEWMRSVCELGYVPIPFASHDSLILLSQAVQSSVAIHGQPAKTLLPTVPPDTLRDAVLKSVDEVLGQLKGDERNVLLTLARMWHTLETGDIVAKDVAASWAGKRLSRPTARTLRLARDAYLGRAHDDWGEQSHDALATALEIASKLAAGQHRRTA